MNAQELRKLDDAKLVEHLDELGAEAMKMRFQRAAMQLGNSAQIKQVRREIARVQTIMTGRKQEKAGE